MYYSVNDLYKSIVLKLKSLYLPEEARAMADRLVEHYLHFSQSQRILNGAAMVDEGEIALIDDSINKLLRNIPLQYVLGVAYFMDMEFIVNPSVLIPRPETEELVSLILKQYSESKDVSKLNILDIGTGSGCIAISLKKFLPLSSVSAIDISEDAIKVAIKNASNNKVEINFIRKDILDHTQWGSIPQLDLIVSNPPYVTHEEKKQMQRNVLDHEPHTALFVPDGDPLLFYREIIALAKLKLCEEGSIWFEINEMFGEDLKELAKSQGFKEVNIFFDIRGKSRFLHAVK